MILNALHTLQERGRARSPANAITAASIGLSTHDESCAASNATRLADVSRCISILSDDISKLPWYMMREDTKERKYTGELLNLLRIRPNEAMTPSVFKRMLMTSVLCEGNGYALIIRDKGMQPQELLPIRPQLVTPHRAANGFVWYSVTHPLTGEPVKVPGMEMIHLKGWSEDGLKGVSVLHRARDVITTGIAAGEYSKAFYQNGGHPSGVLQTDTDLIGDVEVTIDGQKTTMASKEYVRREWERFHSGPMNSFRIAVLDNGLKYVPLTVSQSDAQFVENRKLSRVDISNFFGVPLYKLNDGKQAYSSNEQNAVEYVGSTLQPIVVQWEEEFSYKLLLPQDLDESWRLRMNMMAALRGDTGARGPWYRTMTDIGAFCVNDVLSLEDMPSVAGGDVHMARLDHVPLEDFRELSKQKKGGRNGKT